MQAVATTILMDSIIVFRLTANFASVVSDPSVVGACRGSKTHCRMPSATSGAIGIEK